MRNYFLCPADFRGHEAFLDLKRGSQVAKNGPRPLIFPKAAVHVAKSTQSRADIPDAASFCDLGRKPCGARFVNAKPALVVKEIAALTNGGFVVTWYDGSGTLGDADGSSIKAQVFDAVGTKIGSEFLVNTQTAANQFYPTVAALTNGGFVVTWWDLSGTLGDGSYSSIKAQVFAVVNDAPTGTPTAVLANGTEDVAYTVTAADLLAGFSDADGDVLAVANLAASIGSVVDNGNGSFTITQAADFNGAVTLTYDVTDGHGGTLAGQTLGYTVTAVNDAPTLAISNAVTTLAEGTYANAVQVADITITDDGEGSNNPTLSGADAALFEIVGTELFLKAGTVLDFEGGNAMLDVTVEVDDPLVGGSPEDSEALSISVTDVNEAITNGNGGGTLAGTAGNDLIDGQGGNDSINAGAGNDTIIGGPGRDNVNAGNGDDTIVATIGDGSLDVYGGGAGIDTLDMSGITAPARVNLALSFVSSSQTGLDVLASIENAIGGSGNDVITGNGVANRLDGQGGNDTISAGSGNDIIIGGTGNDTMNGGPGSDTSIFVPGFGNDRVIQFDANPAVGQDRLDISAFGITNADFAARVTIADVGADTLVTIDADAGQTIRLVGIGDAGTVTQADFLL